MKKKIINGILILVVTIIYGAIFGLQDDLLGDIEDESPLNIQSYNVIEQPKKISAIDFKHDRNYFFPKRKKQMNADPKKTAKINKQGAQKPKIKIDTLAIIGNRKDAKYLLKIGDKVWIE